MQEFPAGRWLWCLLLQAALSARPLAAADAADFDRDIRPVLERACFQCHGPDKQQGGLRFDRRASARGPGDSGQLAIVPGRSDESELVRRLKAASPDERMPLDADPLPSGEIALLARWIDAGAEWPGNGPDGEPGAAPAGGAARSELVVTDADRQHWSFRRLEPVAPPEVDAEAWRDNPIDRFVSVGLAAQGLGPNLPADRATLIRRLSFDLIGLPPSREEVEAFVADADPQAYAHLVDRLLASVHYGERWGRHWLDLARYADSNGYEGDADRPDAYPYRDFVIRALNDDLPYSTFVQWQLAGDEMAPDDPRALAATGFLAAAPTEELMVPMEEEKLRLRFAELDDMAANTSLALLGLSLGCARCHDHKFDPIPTRDYYRWQCALMTTARDHQPLVPRAAADAWHAEQAAFETRRAAAKTALNDWLSAQKQPWAEAIRQAKIDALAISEADRQRLREGAAVDGQRLLKEFGKAIEPVDDDFRARFSEPQRERWDELSRELAAVDRSKPAPLPTALAIVDRQAQPAPTWLLERGDFHLRKEPVELGFLTVLTGSRDPADYWQSARSQMQPGRSTGQRRALAEWLTDVDQGAGPLLARVFVNRVWQHHFGEGLARTVSDFGQRGDRPSHPELLEWLARQFVDSGWQIKALHRQIVTSAVYQQSAQFDPVRAAADPDHRWLWRRRPRRLEAETLRDAILSASGTLNRTPYGPAFKPPIPPEAMLARNTKDPYPQNLADTAETRRRSVYLFHKRVVQYPFLQAFDAPDASASCGRRNATTIAPQALVLLNEPFVRARAHDFAQLLRSTGTADAERWVEDGFWRALSRRPTPTETTASLAFIAACAARRAEAAPSDTADAALHSALADFCQTLFSLNEFVYVE